MSTQPTSRRELAALVLTGAVGAAVALLAARMPVARLHVLVPRPLPASVQTITVADVRPATTALAVAALASMLAVLATRSAARRIVGVVAAGLAAGLVAAAVSAVGAAQLVAAAGRGGTRGGGGLSGLPAHLILVGDGWRAVLLAGALDPVDEQEARRVHADGVLKKPFEASLVLQTVKPLLDDAAAARTAPLRDLVGQADRLPSPGLGRLSACPTSDPELIRAAVTIALDAALPGLIEEITQKVLVALNTKS